MIENELAIKVINDYTHVEWYRKRRIPKSAFYEEYKSIRDNYVSHYLSPIRAIRYIMNRYDISLLIAKPFFDRIRYEKGTMKKNPVRVILEVITERQMAGLKEHEVVSEMKAIHYCLSYRREK